MAFNVKTPEQAAEELVNKLEAKLEELKIDHYSFCLCLKKRSIGNE